MPANLSWHGYIGTSQKLPVKFLALLTYRVPSPQDTGVVPAGRQLPRTQPIESQRSIPLDEIMTFLEALES